MSVRVGKSFDPLDPAAVYERLLNPRISPVGPKKSSMPLVFTVQGCGPFLWKGNREGPVLRWVGWGIAAGFRARASLVAENICLRQQLLVLPRRQPRPRIRDVDRRFWVLACRWFPGWQTSLLIVEPVTVLR